MAAIPLLLGHRGARATKAVSENTLPSFDLALEHGCDGFEFDVRRTADGRALVCHDPTVGKLTVCEVNSSELPCCPLLEDVLLHSGHRGFLDIELKVRGLETTVLGALRDCQPQRDYVVSSFLPEVVMELKVRSGAIPVGIICDRASELARWPQLPVEYVIVEQKLISSELIEQVHAANRKIFAWTVNRPECMQKLADQGIDGIIADDTKLLVQTLRVTAAS
jgi:glycerophosphoryl diester phosphodiesterase